MPSMIDQLLQGARGMGSWLTSDQQGYATNPIYRLGVALTGKDPLEGMRGEQERQLARKAQLEQLAMQKAEMQRQIEQRRRLQDAFANFQMGGSPQDVRSRMAQALLQGGEYGAASQLLPEVQSPLVVGEKGSIYDPITGTFKRPPGMGGDRLPSGGFYTPEQFDKQFKEQADDVTPESWLAARTAGDPRLLRRKYSFEEESKMRGEYAPKIERIRSAANAGAQIEGLLKAQGEFRDIGSLYAIIKFLDPDSVVREGEAHLVQNAQGLWTRIQSNLQKAQSKGFITDAMRRDIRSMVDDIMVVYKKQHDKWMDDARKKVGLYPGMREEAVMPLSVDFPQLLPTLPPGVGGPSLAPPGAAPVPPGAAPGVAEALQRNR